MMAWMRRSPKVVQEEAWNPVGPTAGSESITISRQDTGSVSRASAGTDSRVTASSTKARRGDASVMLSADLDSENDDDELTLPPSYPLPLVFFLCTLAAICGFAVIGVHYAVMYAGCPLGLNGCNSFHHKEATGFFLNRWVQDTWGGRVPEDAAYICMAILGASLFTQLLKMVPDTMAFQLRGGGTIQALVAVAGGPRITFGAAFLRVVVTSIYLGTSGTLGFDGPAIQVCTAITSGVGWWLGMRGLATQSLLACLGFAGGFAASFNSPLAGIMFAMEELQHVSHSVSRHIITIILMTSVVATTVARLLQGDASLFDAAWEHEGGLHKVFGPRMWMLVCVPISIACSFFGFSLSCTIRCLWRMIDALRKKKVPLQLITVVMVALSASVGSLVFQITALRGVWGIGYESLQQAFDEDIPGSNFLVFGIGKAVAMMLSVVVHCPGDLLEPVLITGGFLGGSMGRLLEYAIEDEEMASQVVKPCLVFGMVSLFASCFRFPLTPVLIVLEFMGEETYAIVLPTALAGFTAITVSNRLYPPLLDIIMHRDDLDLETVREESEAASSVGGDVEDPMAEPHPSSDASMVSSESSGSVGKPPSSLLSDRFSLAMDLDSALIALASRSNSRTSTVNSHVPHGVQGRPRSSSIASSGSHRLSPDQSRNSSRAASAASHAGSGTAHSGSPNSPVTAQALTKEMFEKKKGSKGSPPMKLKRNVNGCHTEAAASSSSVPVALPCLGPSLSNEHCAAAATDSAVCGVEAAEHAALSVNVPTLGKLDGCDGATEDVKQEQNVPPAVAPGQTHPESRGAATVVSIAEVPVINQDAAQPASPEHFDAESGAVATSGSIVREEQS